MPVRALVVSLALSLCTPALFAQRMLAPSALQLLERSNAGQHQAAIDQLRALPHQALPAIAADLKTAAPGWVTARPAEMRRRRLIAAALALDIADAGLETEWKKLQDLIEVGCRLVRDNPAGEPEHAWFAASIALGQGGFDDKLLIDGHHIAHALDRFPNDRAFKFAQAVTIEITYADGSGPAGYRISAGGEMVTTAVDTQRSKRVSSLQNLDNFQNDAGVIGAEANVRLGFLHFQNKDFDKALPYFAKARTLSDVRHFVYLSYFLEGRAFQALGRIKDAGEAYQKAWRVLPGEGAGEALSLLLFQSSQPTEAYAVATETLDRGVVDPWRFFGYGSFFQLPVLLNQVRTLTASIK
jgi:tetratricopeptide (TPR) repeat protein